MKLKTSQSFKNSAPESLAKENGKAKGGSISRCLAANTV